MTRKTAISHTTATALLWAVVASTLMSAASADDSLGVSVRRISGDSSAGEFLSVTARQLMWRSKGKITKATVDDVLRIDRQPSVPTDEPGALIYLANGDRLAAKVTELKGESLHVVWTLDARAMPVKLSLSSVRAILLQRPDGRAAATKLEADLLSHTAKKDIVVLRNGDRLSGLLKTLDSANVAIANSAQKISRKNVAAIAFDPQYLEAAKQPAKRWLLHMADGSRLTATSVRFQDARLRVDLLGFRGIAVPWNLFQSLQRLQPRLTPLDSLTPADYKHTPYLSGKRVLQKNRNVLGGTLSLRGTRFAHGYGMHSRSRVSFAVPRGAQHFLATIGIDDAARGRGSAIFAVEVDGKRVFTSKPITGKQAPRSLGPIPLTGAKRLTLIADFGPQGDILDYADWCDAFIVMRPAR